MDERSYQEGRAALARRLISELLLDLPADERAIPALAAELDELATAMRRLYEDETGDAAPWPDDLHLTDVLENYIAPLVRTAGEGE